MDEQQLSAILDNEERQAIAFNSTELSEEREDALKRFYGEPYGNEEDGRSQVVSRTVQDTIEWQLPALIKVFVSGDTVVEYQPRGREDEEAAKQRTEYINYVFTQDNNAFLILYTVFKDMLIQKNGVVKVYYDDAAIDETRTVEGLDDEAYTLLTSDPDVEILAHTEHFGTTEYSGAEAGPLPPESGGAVGMMPGPVNAGASPLPVAGNASQAAPMASPTEMQAGSPQAGLMGAGGLPPSPQPSPSVLHDVRYRKKDGRVKVETIPPEQWLISTRATDIRTSPYVADRKRKTISELIAEGFDRDKLEDIGGGDTPELTGEAATRDAVDGVDREWLSDREGVMREVWVTDHYIMVDYDDDGIAERRRVVTAGSTANILLNEEWEGPPPYASFSGILVPHRVIGQSVADQVSDLQLIDTVLTRQMLDNIYLTNVPRYAGKDSVNQDDWYSPNPGQYISTGNENPNEAMMPITIPFTAASTLTVLEHFASVRENRTGVTRYNQGMDADSLNKTARGITQIMTAAQQRTELMARIVAETGMKDMFMLIDHCVTKYQNKARVVRIRDDWVTVDPRQWESNFDMTINVGLGTGNKDQMLMHLQMIAAMQAQVIQLQGGADGPLVTLPNVYETMKSLTENAGLKNVESYWTDPKNAPPQQPKPDPEMMKVQQQGEIEKAKLQQQAQNDQAKLTLDVKKTEAEMQMKWIEMNANLQLQREQAAVKVQADREKMASDQALARDKAASDADLKRTVAESRSQVIVGSNGKAAEVASGTAAMNKTLDGIMQTLAALAQQQAARDAAQDKQLQALMQMITAPTVIERDQNGRAIGSRRVMNGAAGNA